MVKLQAASALQPAAPGWVFVLLQPLNWCVRSGASLLAEPDPAPSPSASV